MNENIDELTVQFEDDNGTVVIKELDKVVLSRGAWTTILFRYQEWRQDRGDYGPDKYTLRRYKKSGGVYRAQSKFTISSPDQARKIIDALSGWLAEAEEKARWAVEEEGCAALELCGGFGNEGAARIARCVSVPVGTVRFDVHPGLGNASGDTMFDK